MVDVIQGEGAGELRVLVAQDLKGAQSEVIRAI